MDEVRRDFRKVQEDTSVYKARIAELESQLSQLLLEKAQPTLHSSRSPPNSPALSFADSKTEADWSSILEANSRHAQDVSAKAARQQQQLTSTQRENAELKRLIAHKESENAELTIESQSLKSQLYKSTARSSSDLEILRSENASLQGNCSRLQEANCSLQNRLHQRDRELAEAHQRITQLLSTGEESSEKIESNEMIVKKLRAQLNQLKIENESLRRDKELMSRTSPPRESSQRKRKAGLLLQVDARLMREHIMHLQNQFHVKFELFQSKMLTELFNVGVRIGRLRVLLGQAAVFVKRRYPSRVTDHEAEEFLAKLDQGIRSIESASRAYSKSHTETRDHWALVSSDT
jgi:DNA repair exonuclease SbcCD ATPase subunit